VVFSEDIFDASICNPPFHASEKEARAATRRKQKNLGQKTTGRSNFGGQPHELWYPGGEGVFVQKMIRESANYATQVLWFTTLISKEGGLPFLQKSLKAVGVAESRVLNMGQGQKKSRILAWTFLDPQRQAKWAALRWNRKNRSR
jgi:23S rRNA (adenine1618-N6)-methyltransferase